MENASFGTISVDTPPKINVSSEEGAVHKESNLPTSDHHFSGAMKNFGGSKPRNLPREVNIVKKKSLKLKPLTL